MDEPSYLKCGYLYAAFGQKYIDEAIASAVSLRIVSPKANITIVSNQEINSSVFDNEINIELETHKNWKLGLVGKLDGLLESPYDKTIFLDTDTYIVHPVEELFNLLDYFDFCMTMAPADLSPSKVGEKTLVGLSCYNTGVIAFRGTPMVKEFLERWRDDYFTNIDECSSDQHAFMQLSATSDVRIHVLHQHYNTRTNLAITLPGAPCKIIHARHSNYSQVAMRINRVIANRSWCPVLQDLISIGPSITPLSLMYKCVRRLYRGLQ